MDRYPANDERLDLEPDVALEDSLPAATDRMPAVGRPRLRIMSAPAAMVGALLVTTIALAGAGLQSTAFDKDATTPDVGQGGTAADATAPKIADGTDDKPPAAEPRWKDVRLPTDEPKAEPKVETTDEAKPAPKAKDAPKAEPKKQNDEPKSAPKPKPAIQSLGLALARGDGKVTVDWTACKGDSFAYYKIVRSTDGTVTWPAGANDKVVGVVESRSKTAMADASAPHGRKVWYRVFCIADKEHDQRVLGRTTARSIVTLKDEPAEKPAPEPSVMGFEVHATADGVVLDWEKCGSDGFVYYKVVRSTGDDPSYLPWTEGSEVIAVIEDGATTSFTDTGVEAGDHVFYRVQSIGVWSGKKVLLGQTPVREAGLE
jgi:hypothetical protein